MVCVSKHVRGRGSVGRREVHNYETQYKLHSLTDQNEILAHFRCAAGKLSSRLLENSLRSLCFLQAHGHEFDQSTKKKKFMFQKSSKDSMNLQLDA